jgi:hypothetical protein
LDQLVATYCSNNSASIGTLTAIGQGETNTANARTSCLGGAVALVNNYNNSNTTGFSNWFIPGSSEAAAMIPLADQIGLIRAGLNWSTGTLGYWTSSESTTTLMRTLNTSGSTFVAGTGLKSEANGYMVHPIRAFRSCWAIDTCTSLSTTNTPIAAGLYSMLPSALTINSGSLNNYTAVTYQPTPLTINKVAPKAILVPWINSNYPDTFTLVVAVSAGGGALKFTASNATASGCAMDYRKVYTTSQGTCTIQIVRYSDRNFFADTTTATVFFLAFINSQPTNQVGSGSTIAINGVTALSVDTTTPPSITSLSTVTLSLGSGGTFTINGSGFGASGLTVKFWRNKTVLPSGSTASTITFNVSDIAAAGATTGRISVTTVNGQAVSVDTLTLTP